MCPPLLAVSTISVGRRSSFTPSRFIEPCDNAKEQRQVGEVCSGVRLTDDNLQTPLCRLTWYLGHVGVQVVETLEKAVLEDTTSAYDFERNSHPSEAS